MYILNFYLLSCRLDIDQTGEIDITMARRKSEKKKKRNNESHQAIDHNEADRLYQMDASMDEVASAACILPADQEIGRVEADEVEDNVVDDYNALIMNQAYGGAGGNDDDTADGSDGGPLLIACMGSRVGFNLSERSPSPVKVVPYDTDYEL